MILFTKVSRFPEMAPLKSAPEPDQTFSSALALLAWAAATSWLALELKFTSLYTSEPFDCGSTPTWITCVSAPQSRSVMGWFGPHAVQKPMLHCWAKDVCNTMKRSTVKRFVKNCSFLL